VNRIGAKAASLLLATLLAWAAFAVFSPIHKHDLGSPAKCSLNHLEAQQAEGPVAVLPDFSLVLIGSSDRSPEPERAAHPMDRRLPARAPPASSC
jgi:hypothetical protein